MATKESNIWHCNECNVDIEHADFPAHLKEKHGITDAKGKRSMVMHADGADFYSWTWEWEIGGKKFVQNTVNKRRGMDAAMWR